MNRTQLRRQLIHHEGLRLHPYTDSVGVRTIGVGRNMEANPIEDEIGRPLDSRGITENEAMLLLNNDIDIVLRGVENSIPAYGHISQPRQHVLLDMAFNLGISGLLRFQNMLAAIERGDFVRASAEMLDSRWARQVPGRANTLAKMMKNNIDFEGGPASSRGSGGSTSGSSSSRSSGSSGDRDRDRFDNGDDRDRF